VQCVKLKELRPIVFKLFDQGMTLEEIALELDKQGYRRTDSRRIVERNIRFCLGMTEIGKHKRKTKKSKPKVEKKEAKVKEEYKDLLEYQFKKSLRSLGFTPEEIERELKILLN
jgi:DNA-binding transcriptional MerR regulator